LCGCDLPLTVALQPCIGPDLALLLVWMCFVLADGVLAAVNDGLVLNCVGNKNSKGLQR